MITAKYIRLRVTVRYFFRGYDSRKRTSDKQFKMLCSYVSSASLHHEKRRFLATQDTHLFSQFILFNFSLTSLSTYLKQLLITNFKVRPKISAIFAHFDCNQYNVHCTILQHNNLVNITRFHCAPETLTIFLEKRTALKNLSTHSDL